MATEYIEERHVEPINILIVFLIGLAAALFLIGSIDSFGIAGTLQTVLIISTCVLYAIALVAFLWPKKTLTPIEIEPEVIEKEVERIVEKPVIKYVEREGKKETDLKSVEVPIVKTITRTIKEPGKTKIALVEVEKKEEKKSKYVGSSYNDRYHLRTCRFAGAIKPEYLIEEDDKKFFELRGYVPCKVCNPNKN